jgi:hypothetical protein
MTSRCSLLSPGEDEAMDHVRALWHVRRTTVISYFAPTRTKIS